MKGRATSRRYWKLKEKKICVTCGQVPPKKGRVRCEKCLKKLQKYYKTVRKNQVKKWKKQEVPKSQY